ncbi:MAG: ribonuclease PH, partial [Sphingomonadales bacterium]|nr:ribonuclease PH [Sphingomonadales bacterium]
VDRLLGSGVLVADPILDHVAAVSCGLYAGQVVLDLDYAEDSEAGTDANFVLQGSGRLIEVQMSAEGAPFSRGELDALLNLAEIGNRGLCHAQAAAVGR